jgi:hypothetical protein
MEIQVAIPLSAHRRWLLAGSLVSSHVSTPQNLHKLLGDFK